MSAKKSKAGELLNTSELAKRAGLNRATVASKLDTMGVRPKQEKAKEKLYDADEALAALADDDRSTLRKAQTAKTAVEAQRVKIKLDKERGELVPIQDVRADLQAVIQRVYQHFVGTAPATLAPQLKGQKVAQIEATLKRDAEQFFSELRAEQERYLSE